ncbi:MAG: hypothetical protein JWP27_1402 [Flaviaesturariibacter sp.]|nr:hypothetical protein [Flaviaesturariibacter sp.]
MEREAPRDFIPASYFEHHREPSLKNACMEQPADAFVPEKYLWTQDDFDKMGWHDSQVHAISFGENGDLLLDIDYIFKWAAGATHFRFWVSPCTLVFENVYDVDFDLSYSTGGLAIDQLSRDEIQPIEGEEDLVEAGDRAWTIALQQGLIQFKSAGFRQFIRARPLLLNEQALEISQRGGISFDQKTGEA